MVMECTHPTKRALWKMKQGCGSRMITALRRVKDIVLPPQQKFTSLYENLVNFPVSHRGNDREFNEKHIGTGPVTVWLCIHYSLCRVQKKAVFSERVYLTKGKKTCLETNYQKVMSSPSHWYLLTSHWTAYLACKQQNHRDLHCHLFFWLSMKLKFCTTTNLLIFKYSLQVPDISSLDLGFVCEKSKYSEGSSRCSDSCWSHFVSHRNSLNHHHPLHQVNLIQR